MYDRPWTTRDGRVMRIGDMSTKHVYNCIALINLSGRRWRPEYLARLRLELVIRRLGK